MFKRIFIVALLAAAIASAKSYTFTVSDPAHAGTAQLKPGEYRIELDGSQVVLMDSKNHRIDTSAKVEEVDHKFDQTSVVYTKSDGGNKIISIQLGRSRSRVLFE